MDELRNNPQVTQLLETLEENGMQKEKGEVSALVSYIGDMEHTLSAMLAEMQEMRKEVNMIHNSSIKAKCENLIHTADSKIRQGIETVSKAKNNLISSAENAVKVFKEKGKEAFKNSINAMKISDTLDKLGKVFHSFSVSMNESVQNVQNARVILGAHIDGAGGSIVGGGLKVGAGSVIEGNNYTISNFSGNNIFNLENGAQIEIRNLQFGTEEQPLELTGGLVSAYTRCVSRWENVRIYANLTASSGNKGVWFDAANGSHTFVNCETHATVNGGSGNVGAWFGQTNEAGCSIRFEGCSIYGSVTSTNNAGSIIGYMSGPIYMKDCINYADISGAQNAGGFVAHDTVDAAAAMYFENCANYGMVTASNANGTAGGFCGQDRRPGTYLNCANYGTIKSGAANNIKAGGLLGQKDGTGSTMTNCVNYGSIEARGTIGGIVGSITGMLTCSGCVNAADVTMLESGDHAGGFVGWAVNVTLDHCANIGAITSIGSSSGNLIGKPNAYTITDCYGFGIVSGGSNGVLIGAVNDGVTGTSTGNKYLNGNQAGTIGAEEQGLVATVAEAVELLEAYYADLTFEIVDGAIVIRPAA